MSNLKILIIDDDPNLIESLADFLGVNGHEVDIAMTAEEGIAAVDKKDYDAILIDIGLPDTNGVTTSYKIKELKPASRILLMTGFSNDQVDREFTPGDPLPFMTKPLDLEKMMAWLTSRVRPFKTIHNGSGTGPPRESEKH